MDHGPYKGIIDRDFNTDYFYSTGDLDHILVAELLFRAVVA